MDTIQGRCYFSKEWASCKRHSKSTTYKPERGEKESKSNRRAKERQYAEITTG